MKMNRILKPIVASFALASVSHGAVISWSSPVNITGNSDVSTTGSFVQAYNLASVTNTTVNGVEFLGTTVTPSAVGQSVANRHTFAPTTGYSTAVLVPDYTGSAGAFGGLTSEYRDLLRSFASGSGAVAVANGGANRNGSTLTLHDLVPDQEYLLQIWVNDSRGTNTVLSGHLGLDITAPTVPGGGITVNYNSGTAGSLGQYVIGTFTADATTQSFSIYSGGSSGLAILNAYQLRTIPEPSTALLGVLGLSGLALRRRR